MKRTKWLAVGLMILGIVLLPSPLRAPETSGQVAAQTPADFSITQLPNPSTPPLIEGRIGGVELQLPFSTESRWGSGDESSPGIWWDTNEGDKYFAIEDGKFISTDSSDTWFVYGWFGSLSAIKEDYNIKYPEWQDKHNGIDFAGREGLEVVSASSGEVVFAGDKVGNTVIVRNGDYQTTYGHLRDINVKVGEKLTPGALLGHLGSTGTANPHLHFQVDYILDELRIAINPVASIDTDWSEVIVPAATANSFYEGPIDPALQPNFIW